MLAWPCAHRPYTTMQMRERVSAALGVPRRCQGQSGTCQARLKPFSRLFSSFLPKSLAKGLAFNPQGPCCTGNKIHLLLRSPGLPSWPSLDPTAFPRACLLASCPPTDHASSCLQAFACAVPSAYCALPCGLRLAGRTLQVSAPKPLIREALPEHPAEATCCPDAHSS